MDQNIYIPEFDAPFEIQTFGGSKLRAVTFDFYAAQISINADNHHLITEPTFIQHIMESDPNICGKPILTFRDHTLMCSVLVLDQKKFEKFVQETVNNLVPTDNACLHFVRRRTFFAKLTKRLFMALPTGCFVMTQLSPELRMAVPDLSGQAREKAWRLLRVMCLANRYCMLDWYPSDDAVLGVAGERPRTPLKKLLFTPWTPLLTELRLALAPSPEMNQCPSEGEGQQPYVRGVIAKFREWEAAAASDSEV